MRVAKFSRAAFSLALSDSREDLRGQWRRLKRQPMFPALGRPSARGLRPGSPGWSCAGTVRIRSTARGCEATADPPLRPMQAWHELRGALRGSRLQLGDRPEG